MSLKENCERKQSMGNKMIKGALAFLVILPILAFSQIVGDTYYQQIKIDTQEKINFKALDNNDGTHSIAAEITKADIQGLKDILEAMRDGTQVSQATDGFQQSGVGLNGFRITKTSLETQIFQEGFADDLNTVETWSVNTNGGGTITVANGEGVIKTTATAQNVTLFTQVPHPYLHGFSNLWRVRMILNTDQNVSGSTQTFGIATEDDGYYWSIDGDGVSANIKRQGVVTKFSTATWQNIDLVQTTGTAHSYAIQYLNGNRVVFWYDDIPILFRGSQTGSLIATSNLPTRVTSFQTEEVGERTMTFTGLAVLREGAPFQFDTAGRLRVSGGVAEAPEGTTEVVRPLTPKITISPNATIDDFYTITADTTLVLQVLDAEAVSAGVGKSIIIELFDDPNGDASVLLPIPGGILMGNNFNDERVIDKSFAGDGVRRILLRTTQDGSASMIVARSWRGFEQ